ncbi:PE-PGRS family protein [Streptomyces sp. Act143]|uniref:PE-PGRS family protein n=1 Tax=Streptomyces sp. Act143 TaxID=2200760 RepID=UPI000D684A41|nr:PE-PGRS family protein [Streptomyces sp. Act143]PWI20409.1 PE-PGRS family protein [Streptomyces sp. Act143]
MRGGAELVELLGRAGLEMVGERRVEEVLPAPFAWRYVTAWQAEPSVTVASDRPDLVGDLNAEWHRLASDAGIFGADGVFLVDFPGSGTDGWVRVRLCDRWDLAGVLGERSGQPEFVTMSLDGDVLVGATTEEYAVWLVAVDRVRQRREEAARMAGLESPEEREAAWETLFRGPRCPQRVLDAWASGLSLNPATPAQLRPLLPARTSYALYGALPAEAVDALLADPDWEVRSRAAAAQPDITPGQWARVLLAEQDERQRWLLAMTAAERQARVAEDACRALAADPSARVRSEAARLRGLPASVAVQLAADPADGVRAVACRTAWPHLDAAGREALLADSHAIVRARSRVLYHQDRPMPRAVFDAEDVEGADGRALETCLLERDLAEHLARHGERAQRRSLAANPRLDPDLVALLAEDHDDGVRFEVSKRPDLTEEQRSGIPVEPDPGTRHFELDWVKALHHDEDAMRRLAASSHFLVRRGVARARHLPPDVVERLARDEDRIVQLFLAESCDDAPADLLLRVWRWWDGSLSTPDRPRGHPNFPRHDLLRYADDPSPRMRRLALDDPESTPELVERLSRDMSEEVRYRAATDPRLSATAAARLLEDPHEHVRQAAALHPRMPARLLVGLLRGGGAETAARNPGLPVDVVRRMVDAVVAGAVAGAG